MAAPSEAIRKRYPKSCGYAPLFVEENRMGPNALWLAEELCACLDLRPGMRVLDMGAARD